MKRVIFLCEHEYEWYIRPVQTALHATGLVSSEVVGACGLQRLSPEIDGINLLVTPHSFLVEILEFCRRMRGRIPSLTIQDGLIEHKSSQHRFQGIYRYRPLETDYIAVFGERSRALVAAYGADKERVFVTGCPRFDTYLGRARQEKDGYVLITMANRPGYGTERALRFYALLDQVLEYMEGSGTAYKLRSSRGIRPGGIESPEKLRASLPLRVVAAITKSLQDQTNLQDDLEGASAVITTPSTVSLEAMLLDRPVCHLLPDPETVYTSSAWTITNSSDIPSVITELRNPPDLKKRYQKLVLEENLLTSGSATTRVRDLILNLLGLPI